MIGRVVTHVRNQWMGALALLIAAGGTAYAAAGPLDGPAPGQNSVGSLDIINGQVQNSDIQDNSVGGSKVKNSSIASPDVADGSVGGWDVDNETLTGDDIADDTLTGRDIANPALTGADIVPRSGVDSCVASVRLGSLCVRGENSARVFNQALAHCGNLDMRLPSLGEALQLARTHDIPNADETEWFWTDELSLQDHTPSGTLQEIGYIARDDGLTSPAFPNVPWETVCVSTPVN